MRLQIWRNTCPNPCDDPKVSITIAPMEKGQNVFPWVLPITRAIEIFGQDDVDKITEMPREVFLTMTLANRNE